MLRKFSLLFAGAFALLFLSFCKKEKPAVQVDEDNPEIFISSPWLLNKGEFFPVTSGQPFAIDIRFEDDVDLKEYKIEVYFDFEQEYHKTNNDFWLTEKTGQLSGLADGINTTMMVPSDPSAGPYKFIVTVWDRSGKSSTITTYLNVTNSRDIYPPVVTITSLDTTQVDTHLIASNLIIQGGITDNGLVRVCYIRMLSESDLALVPGSEIRVDSIDNLSYVVDTFLTPLGISPGNYILEVFGTDSYRNVAKETVQLYMR